MSEMVERVTAEVRAKLNSMPFADRTIEATVRLVMEAMREPTEAMVKAGNKCTDWASGSDDAWEAMIDEALK